MARVERYLARHLIAYFGERWLRKIKSRSLFYYRSRRLREGAAAATINKEVSLLERVCRKAGVECYVRPLPVAPRAKGITSAEFQRLVAVAAEHPLWTNALAVACIVAVTGLPWRVLSRLTWAAMDPFREALTVNGAETPITPELLQSLVALEQQRTSALHQCRISDTIIKSRKWQKAWKSMTAAAGFEGLRVTDLRDLR